MTSYVSNSPSRKAEMLSIAGVKSIKDLFKDVPAEKRLDAPLELPHGLSEMELLSRLETLSHHNILPGLNFLGGGAYRHFIPATVKAIIGRSEFYTAYTPYQPEVSQGALQAIYEFQTYIAKLSGMDASNASVYDGASALAEGAAIAWQQTRRNKILVSRAVHPQYRQVLNTYMAGRGLQVVEIPLKNGETDFNFLSGLLDGEVAVVVVQSPNFLGILEDYQPAIQAVHDNKSLFLVCSAEAFSLAAVKSPGGQGADIFAGEGQSLGLPVSFGGPGIGLLAVKKNLMRKLPGRISGKTLDAEGKECFILTLQAREQHIRREKAGSNICTNQGLCSIAVTVFLSTVGNKLQDLALQNMHKARYAAGQLAGIGELVYNKPFFNEFVIKLPGLSGIYNSLINNGIVPGLLLEPHYAEMKDCLLVCVTETNTREQIDALSSALREARS